MKPFIYILIVIAAILIGFTIINNKKVREETPIVTNEVGRELCYIWNTEAGDKATLRMNILENTQVTGSFDFIPAEKDKKIGTFTGTAEPLNQATMSRTAHVWWKASAEGVTNTEELTIIFGEGMAAAGFGEMKNRGDGVYVYANPAEISYNPGMQQTGCTDEAM